LERFHCSRFQERAIVIQKSLYEKNYMIVFRQSTGDDLECFEIEDTMALKRVVIERFRSGSRAQHRTLKRTLGKNGITTGRSSSQTSAQALTCNSGCRTKDAAYVCATSAAASARACIPSSLKRATTMYHLAKAIYTYATSKEGIPSASNLFAP